MVCIGWGLCISDAYVVKVTLFKTFVSNFYCTHLWCKYNMSVLHKFKVAYNKVFRKLFSINRLCSISLEMLIRGVNVMKIILRRYINSISNRVFSSDNEIIKNIVKSDIMLKSKLFLKWNDMLYSIRRCI